MPRVEVESCAHCGRAAPCYAGCVSWRITRPALTATATGRSALELALGRACWRLYTVGNTIADPEDPERTAERYEAALAAYDKAKAALREWDDHKGGTDEKQG